MPLIIVLFIGILAFGVFDLMFDRSLPVAARQHSAQQNLNSPIENANLPSIPVAAASETAHCERHDTACQLVALYRFVLTTISPEVSRSPWLHTQQHPARTLFMQRGDVVDIAILFPFLISGTFATMWLRSQGQLCPGLRHFTIRRLYQAGGRWQWIDAYALNIGDAPCPCLLLNPSVPINQQPGNPLPFFSDAVRSTMDLGGQRHALISSTLSDTAQH
jgi:hypothetical protein